MKSVSTTQLDPSNNRKSTNRFRKRPIFEREAMAATMALTCAHIAAAPSPVSRCGDRRSGVACAVGRARVGRRVWRVRSQSEKAKTTEEAEELPSWAKPGAEELPPWARNEAAAPVGESGDLPFPAYLVGSCLVAIAAVGSIFEYFNQNPLFGVVQPDNPLWAPILGVFAITGFPSAGFLFYKAISLANKASEEADRADGYDP